MGHQIHWLLLVRNQRVKSCIASVYCTVVPHAPPQGNISTSEDAHSPEDACKLFVLSKLVLGPIKWQRCLWPPGGWMENYLSRGTHPYYVPLKRITFNCTEVSGRVAQSLWGVAFTHFFVLFRLCMGPSNNKHNPPDEGEPTSERRERLDALRVNSTLHWNARLLINQSGGARTWWAVTGRTGARGE